MACLQLVRSRSGLAHGLSGGIGRITGTVVGTVILGIMTSGFTFIGLDAYIQDIVKGGIIVTAVVADRYRHQSST